MKYIIRPFLIQKVYYKKFYVMKNAGLYYFEKNYKYITIRYAVHLLFYNKGEELLNTYGDKKAEGCYKT